MTELEEKAARAIAAIRAAFPAAGIPAREQAVGVHCPECRETGERLLGKPWPEVTASDVQGLPVSLLPAPAFRYYLPAFMTRSIEHPIDVDTLHVNLMSALSPPGGVVHERHSENLLHFTGGQVAAIIAFLDWRLAYVRAQQSEADAPPEAIESIPPERPLRRAFTFWNGVLSGERRITMQ